MITGDIGFEVEDNLKLMTDQIEKLMSLKVYVGVPEQNASRSGETINNAELAYIHSNGIRSITMREKMQPNLNKGIPYSKAYQMYIQENGSPLYQSPPRPILDPVIKENMKLIDKKFQEVSKEILNNPQANVKDEFEKIGTIVRDKIKENFTDSNNGWAPNSASTIKRKGSNQPLINTGSLRNSIEFVVAP